MLCSNAGDGIDPRRRRIRAAALSMFEDASDGGRDALPACGLFSELLSARLGEAIELRTPVVFGITPGGFDPALLLETVERGVKRSLRNLQHVARDLLQPLRDAPAVHVAGREGSEDEQIEGTLEKVGLRGPVPGSNSHAAKYI